MRRRHDRARSIGQSLDFKADRTLSRNGELLEEPTPDQKIIVAKEHLHRLVLAKGEKMGPKEFRSQAAYYLKGIPRSARAKAALNSADTEEEMHEIFDGFLADYQARNSK